MIKHTFCFLEGIGQRKEELLWKQGIFDWDDFLKAEKIKGISIGKKAYYDRKIIEANRALISGDSSFFAGLGPEAWRIFSEFYDECVYLDIESSGVERDAYITVIGLFDGIDTKVMVRHVNLDEKRLSQELKQYKIIVTYNGGSFDLPFLKKRMKGIIPNIPHIDLKTLCWRNNLFGGLKEIEKMLGIKRHNRIVEQMYGGDPLLLWRRWLATGDEDYLNLLVEYNEEDCINLKQIMHYCFERSSQSVFEQIKNNQEKDNEKDERNDQSKEDVCCLTCGWGENGLANQS